MLHSEYFGGILAGKGFVSLDSIGGSGVRQQYLHVPVIPDATLFATINSRTNAQT